MGGFTALGGVLPILSSVAGAIRTVESAVGAIQGIGGRSDNQKREQDLRQLQARQKLDARQAAQKAALEKQQLALESQAKEDARRDALRRAVARQRASFGAAGVGSGAGSSEAVLLGLFEESDAQRAERERLDYLRGRSIGLGLSQARAANLLEATQLSERNNLLRQFVS